VTLYSSEKTIEMRMEVAALVPWLMEPTIFTTSDFLSESVVKVLLLCSLQLLTQGWNK